MGAAQNARGDMSKLRSPTAALPVPGQIRDQPSCLFLGAAQRPGDGQPPTRSTASLLFHATEPCPPQPLSGKGAARRDASPRSRRRLSSRPEPPPAPRARYFLCPTARSASQPGPMTPLPVYGPQPGPQPLRPPSRR